MRRRRHPISYAAVMRPRPVPPPAGVRVSDHAILRWLERVHGIDVESARGEILAAAGPAAAVGASAVRRDGHCIVIERGTIVTVIPADRRRFTER